MKPELRECLNRLRRILRQRGNLSDDDQTYLEDNLELGREGLAQELFGRISVMRTILAQKALAVDLAGAYAELAQVHPSLRAYETPRQVSDQIVGLDGLDAVAFDAARNALSLLSEYEAQLGLWEAWWCEYSAYPSRDNARNEFRVVMADDFSALAELRGFVVYYQETQSRIGRAYAKLSRFFGAEQEVWNMSGVGQKGWGGQTA